MNDQSFSIRRATAADASIITTHRRAMFEDMGAGTPATWDAMDAKFAPWVARKLARGESGFKQTNEMRLKLAEEGNG